MGIPNSSQARLAVLVANSDQEMTDWIRLVLSGIGIEAEIATGGVDCIEQIHECVPDVLIVDSELNWGGAEGILAVLREDPAFDHLPVVALLAPGETEGSAGLAFYPVVRKLGVACSALELVEAVQYAASLREAQLLSG